MSNPNSLYLRDNTYTDGTKYVKRDQKGGSEDITSDYEHWSYCYAIKEMIYWFSRKCQSVYMICKESVDITTPF